MRELVAGMQVKLIDIDDPSATFDATRYGSHIDPTTSLVELGSVLQLLEGVLFNCVGNYMRYAQDIGDHNWELVREVFLRGYLMGQSDLHVLTALPLSPELYINLATTSLIRERLRQLNPALIRALFGFCNVSSISYGSPLTIGTIGIITGATFLPAIIFYSCMRAFQAVRRLTYESDIRETELSLKKQELAQQIVHTEMLKAVGEAMAILRDEQRLEISKEMLLEISKVSIMPISQLASNPLIGSITVGFGPHTK
jgi:hypothetical protein